MPPSSFQPSSGSFRPEAISWKSRQIIKPLIVAVILFAVAGGAFMLPVYLPRLLYAMGGHAVQSTASTGAAMTGAVSASTAASSAPVAPVVSADPVLIIPKLNVSAPIVFEPSTSNDVILKDLRNGVVHYGTTSAPGQTGNTAIFGHSSNDWWKPGNYNQVFVLLDKLAAGDRIQVNYQGKAYLYEVTGSRVVQPTDFSVLDPTPAPTLTLITCTPVGTSLRRLVVSARQVDPNPSGATASTAVVSAPTSASAAAAPSGAAATSAAASSQATLVGTDTDFFTTIRNGWTSVMDKLF